MKKIIFLLLLLITGNTNAQTNIDLVSFNTRIKNNITVIDWTTSSETNNNYFILSKSIDAVNYTDIGKINGSGNSIEDKTYQFIDKFLYDGLNYYRLTQVDCDGQKKTFYPLCIRYINKENKNLKRTLNVSGQEVDENYDDNTTIISN